MSFSILSIQLNYLLNAKLNMHQKMLTFPWANHAHKFIMFGFFYSEINIYEIFTQHFMQGFRIF